MTADPVAIARDLLRCPSVTPAEGGALALLEGVLKRAGFTSHRVHLRGAGHDPIENLYARIGTGAPHLVFAGHTDVVPPGDETRWTHPPFAGEIADGMLYGRGAVDMKGGDRLLRRGRARLSRGARRQAERLDLVPDHRRRGRRRGQRHRQAAGMGGGARREVRPLHSRRADQSAGARRHDQDRPARLAERHADRHRQAGPRRLSGARRQSGARHRRADRAR